MRRLSYALLCLTIFVAAGCRPQPQPPTPRPSVAPGRPVPPFTPQPSGPPPVTIPPQYVHVPPTPARINAVVVLDPGHGGANLGANYFGVREKDVNLAVALMVAERLRQRGATVHLTRTDDRFVELKDRSAFANRHPGALFISIHANAAPRPTAAGIETFVIDPAKAPDAARAAEAAQRYNLPGLSAERNRAEIAAMTVRSRERGKRLADAVQRSLVAGTGDENRGVKQATFQVLKENYFTAAILVEMGFLTHEPSARKMADRGYQARIADAVVEGVARFLQSEGAR